MSLPPPVPRAVPSPEPLPRRILIAVTAALALTATGDFLLWWPVQPGFSLALFAVAMLLAIFAKDPRAIARPRVAFPAALFLASTVQTAFALSLSNFLVLFVLTFVLLGESLFPGLATLWQRLADAVLALAFAPLRWVWVARFLARIPLRSTQLGRTLSVAFRVALPTLLITGLFALLLGEGNSILALKFAVSFQWLGELLARIDLSITHLLFWFALCTFALGLTYPASAKISPGVWGLRLPRLAPPADLTLALWRSWSILGALNALFFAANTIDAAYLWVHQALPAGTNYSDYVHHGVYSLIGAVLLSAVVIVILTEQSASIASSRVLRGFSLLWIAQNIALVASVVLRLKLYVETYQLTELRLYVAFFLVLVTVGFLLLAWRIVRAKSLWWLLSANLGATFALFFVVQFLDSNRWIANYNVEQWLGDPKRTLDVEYLTSLGSAAYPALIRAAETPDRSDAHAAFLLAQAQRETQEAQHPGGARNWRERQFRTDGDVDLLLKHEMATRRP